LEQSYAKINVTTEFRIVELVENEYIQDFLGKNQNGAYRRHLQFRPFWIEIVLAWWYSFSTNLGSGNPFLKSVCPYLSLSSRNLVFTENFHENPSWNKVT